MEDYEKLSTDRGMSFAARPMNFSARPTFAIEMDGPAGLAQNEASLVPARPEESLIVDDRTGLTPAQAVEGKLMNLLRHASLPVSHLQMRGLVRGRCEE